MKQKLPKFKVLTKMSVLDISYETEKQNQRDLTALVEEQNEILEKKRFDFNKYYKVHFYDSYYTNDCTTEMCIHDAVQCLAIKDGYDLVLFENGNYGFVAYYNGNDNGFEILSKSEK